MKFLLGLSFALCLELTATRPAWAFAPNWFSDFEKTVPGCDLNYLCVTGEGATLNEALAMGRLEMAKYFATKIESTSQVTLASEQKGHVSTASVEEWTSKSLNEETSEILSGVEIKKQEEASGRYYVVMGLNKSITEKEISGRIEELDLINAKAFDFNSRFAFPKILRNLTLLDALIDRYRLVSSRPVKLKVSRDQVLEKMNKLKPIKLAMVTKGRKLPAKISHSFIDMLSPLRVIIVPLKSTPRYTLVSEIIVEDQYFKVSGFKKLNVNLRVQLHNSEKVSLGKISVLSEQVARSTDQAIEKAAPELKDYLQDHLDELTTLKMEE
jgi:hypothetical protein